MNLYAAVPNFDEPIDALHICHDNILRRMKSIETMAADLAAQGPTVFAGQIEIWREIFSFFAHSIANHTRDEEEGLFPMLHGKLDGPVEEMLAQHDWSEESERWLLKRFERLCESDAPSHEDLAEFARRAVELARFYERHIAFENETIFPQARKALDQEQIAALGRLMRSHRRISIGLPTPP
jgi:hemerythrin-like domain-containing protein